MAHMTNEKRGPVIAALIICLTLALGLLIRHGVFTTPVQGKDTYRQSITGWNIRLFVRDDPNIFNPRQAYLNVGDNIRRYEFPIYQWSVAMAEKVVGEHIFIQRFISYLISLFALVAIFRIGVTLSSSSLTAALGVWTVAFFPTFFYNSTNIMPDMLGLCFALFYLSFFLRYLIHGRLRKDLIFSGIFIALAGLTKLPFILLGSITLVEFVRLLRSRDPVAKKEVVPILVINALAVIIVIAWYAVVIPDWTGNDITAGLVTHFAGWPVLLGFLKAQLLNNIPCEVFHIPGLVIASFGFILLGRKKKCFQLGSSFVYFPFLVIMLYFLYVLNEIREGHDYYLMPFYPVILLPVLNGLHSGMRSKLPRRILLVLLLGSMPVICWFRVKDYWNIEYAFVNPEFFTCRESFESVGSNRDIAILGNDPSGVVLSYVLDKKSFMFGHDDLPLPWLEDMIQRGGARYFYSNSRIVEEQDGFDRYVDSLLLECGSFKVFKLKLPGQ